MTWRYRIRTRPRSILLYGIGALFLGVTAFVSGLIMILDPSGVTMGLEPEWLDQTPFQDYRIPGLLLFSVLGIGSFIVLYGLVTMSKWSWIAAVGLGVALVGWIGAQILLLQMYHVLQLIYGLLGVAFLVLSFHPSTRQELDL